MSGSRDNWRKEINTVQTFRAQEVSDITSEIFSVFRPLGLINRQMSFTSFKQTLKRCSDFPNPSSSQPSILNEDLKSPQLPRKPPKSSLSQQLQRLQDPLSLPPPKQNQEQPVKENVQEVDDDGDAEASGIGISREPVSTHFQFDPSGPFEPMVLSSPDESPVVQVPAAINCRLLEHQREGVRFLYGLYKKNHGGILGDDMGLGKTIQTIAFLAAVVGDEAENGDSKMLKSVGKKNLVLIICPTSIIQNWENEFSKWAKFSVSVYHGANRDLIIEKLESHGIDVVITSFDSFRIHGEILSEVDWHIVVVDEAHRLKNEKSKLYGACLGIKTRNRYGLTGTVMQNKIMELFNLFDWVAPGSLGTREHFRDFYDEPLKLGQRSSAPERFVQVADERKQHLASVLRRYLLRRTKEETIGHLMMGKEDNVVFCAMSDLQRRAYRRMLQLPDIQCLVNKDLPCSCGSPLKQVECCNRIVPNGIIWSYLHRENPDGCDSCPFCLVLPCLVKLQQLSNHLELIKPNPKDDIEKQKKDAELASVVFGTDIHLVGGNTQSESFMNLSDVEHCGKMRALEKLMSTWVLHGDKILLFSYSVRMLDILEKFLIRRGYCFSRLDGSTPTSSRQPLVDDFNSSPSKQVFLISTRAGGLGLNLVSANRVVIFDPNWNPAQDLQAQDRSFRYGQKRHVVVFRLLAAGSLEELVYSRQVYKQQLSNIAVSGKMEKRYFEGVQDCKEFQGELFGISNLFRDLSDKLFTSEIIELNGKHDQNHGNRNDQAEDIVGTCPPSKEENETSPVDSEGSRYDNLDVAVSNKAMLEALGIVYTHRNEDVVNYKPEVQAKKDMTVAEPDSTQHQRVASSVKMRSKSSSDLSKKELSDLSKKELSLSKKKSQYSRLAQFMGMTDIKFSKWLLSVSNSEREKVLRDYKKQKEKIQNG